MNNHSHSVKTNSLWKSIYLEQRQMSHPRAHFSKNVVAVRKPFYKT